MVLVISSVGYARRYQPTVRYTTAGNTKRSNYLCSHVVLSDSHMALLIRLVYIVSFWVIYKDSSGVEEPGYLSIVTRIWSRRPGFDSQ